MSESAYLSDILGHAEGSLDVSKSYSTVAVVKNEDAEPEEPEPEKVEDMVVPKIYQFATVRLVSAWVKLLG